MKHNIAWRQALRLLRPQQLFWQVAAMIAGLSIWWPCYSQCPTAACVPSSAPAANQALGFGIYRVQLAGLDTTTNGAADGYRNYSCGTGAVLQRGNTYTLTVRTSPNADETVRAWVDFDNNGQFTTAEQVLSSTARQHQATFTVPLTAVTGRALRLRLAADYVNAPVPTACSTPQYSQTEDYRILVSATNPARPLARFAAVDTVTCGAAVVFQDQSWNTPTNWRWHFGDGTTSSQQHPTHTYAQPGTYAVRLRACNAVGCDSLTKPAYILVRADAPRAAPCQPPTTGYCCGFGLTRFQLGSLNHASADGQAGYEDFSCAQRATLTADRPVQLQLTTGSNAHDVRVYLDLNDNGQFDLPAELLYQGLGVQNPTVAFQVAASAAGLVYNRPLRLRCWVDGAGATPFGPCISPQQGQVEDYAVTVLPNGAPPVAAFSFAYQQLCGPVRVALTNTTTGGATAYAWDFGDGTTDTQANPPAHTYSTPGVYEVRLVAQNALGRDTLQQRVAVARACPNYCRAQANGGTTSSPAYFTRLQFADLDNVDPRGPGVAYRDFTARYATVVAGQRYTYRATFPPWSFSGSGPWVAVDMWIDYNQDGEFGPSEQVARGNRFSPTGGSVTVPAGAVPGATRLRAIIHSANHYIYPNACTPAYLTGSIEDYTVVIVPPPVAPTTGFAADLPTACNGLVQFRDTSWAAPNAWQWSFGDGGTSTQQHPLHAYAATGTYSVSLRTSNAYGASTRTMANYLTVSALAAGPRPAACLPSPVSGIPQAQHGIDSLRIGPLRYHQPMNSPGYRDETCAQGPVTWTRGGRYALRFVDSNMFDASCVVWLDANDNGIFEAPGELLYSSLGLGSWSGSIVGSLTVPTATVVGRPLRLRVVSAGADRSGSGYTVPSPCVRDETTGQVRDFAVLVTNPLGAHPDMAPTEWQLAPNPTLGKMTVYGSFLRPTPVEVRDVLGRCVQRATVVPNTNGQLLLDLTDLPRGMYLLRIAGSRQAVRLLRE